MIRCRLEVLVRLMLGPTSCRVGNDDVPHTTLLDNSTAVNRQRMMHEYAGAGWRCWSSVMLGSISCRVGKGSLPPRILAVAPPTVTSFSNPS